MLRAERGILQTDQRNIRLLPRCKFARILQANCLSAVLSFEKPAEDRR